MASQVTLWDGSQVPEALVGPIFMQLEQLQQENRAALWDLAMKCRDSFHVIGPLMGDQDPFTTLKKYKFLDSNAHIISQDIRSIVLNSIKDVESIDDDSRILNLVLINPILNVQINLPSPESNQWKWCAIL